MYSSTFPSPNSQSFRRALEFPDVGVSPSYIRDDSLTSPGSFPLRQSFPSSASVHDSISSTNLAGSTRSMSPLPPVSSMHNSRASFGLASSAGLTSSMGRSLPSVIVHDSGAYSTRSSRGSHASVSSITDHPIQIPASQLRTSDTYDSKSISELRTIAQHQYGISFPLSSSRSEMIEDLRERDTIVNTNIQRIMSQESNARSMRSGHHVIGDLHEEPEHHARQSHHNDSYEHRLQSEAHHRSDHHGSEHHGRNHHGRDHRDVELRNTLRLAQEVLPYETISNIMMQLDLERIYALCQSDPNIRKVCEDRYFWIQKLARDFPGTEVFVDPNDQNGMNIYRRFRDAQLLELEQLIALGQPDTVLWKLSQPYVDKQTNPDIQRMNTIVVQGDVNALLANMDGFAPDTMAIDIAAWRGNIDILNVLADSGLYPDSLGADLAIEAGNIEVLNWLKYNEIYPTALGIGIARIRNDPEVIAWLTTNNI